MEAHVPKSSARLKPWPAQYLQLWRHMLLSALTCKESALAPYLMIMGAHAAKAVHTESLITCAFRTSDCRCSCALRCSCVLGRSCKNATHACLLSCVFLCVCVCVCVCVCARTPASKRLGCSGLVPFSARRTHLLPLCPCPCASWYPSPIECLP